MVDGIGYRWRTWLAAWAAASLVLLASAPGHASWLDGLKQQLGIADKAARPVDPLLTAFEAISQLDVKPPALVLAANVSDEGHWTFINKAGQKFTVAGKEEMARVYRALAPDIAGRPAPVVIYVAGESVFRRAQHLELLPVDARIRIVTGAKSFPMVAYREDGKRRWYAKVTSNVFVRAQKVDLFDETVWQLLRPLSAHNLRLIGLDPAARDTFRPARPGTPERPGIDTINPARLSTAITTLRQQTLLMTGRLDGLEKLVYRAPSGFESELALGPVRQEAATVDANLVVFDAPAPRQPGGRNWLWQNVEVDGLTAALQRKTLGEFLHAMVGTTNQLLIEASSLDSRRTHLRVVPMSAGALERKPGSFSSVVAELVSEVVGNVLPHAVELDLVSKQRQTELDRRLILYVPSWVQQGMAAALVLGLIGIPMALQWWRRIWPPETRHEYAGVTGYLAALGMRWLVFVFLFLPIAGMPAVLWGVCLGTARLLGLTGGARSRAGQTKADESPAKG